VSLISNYFHLFYQIVYAPENKSVSLSVCLSVKHRVLLQRIPAQLQDNQAVVSKWLQKSNVMEIGRVG
jgi:hypothetical protein